MTQPHRFDECCEDFDRDGYVAVRELFDRDGVEELRENCERFVRDVVPGLTPAEVFHEVEDDPDTLKQIQRMHEYDDWFGKLIGEGPLRSLAEALLGGPVEPRNLQYFNKPPGVGRPTPPHQDGYYFMLEPCSALTMWLALDPVDAENGCIHYVRGSNRRRMRPHGRTRTLGFSQGIVDYPTPEDLRHEVAVPAQPGDLLAHHALTIHSAGPNHSNRMRRALGFIYYDVKAREDEVAHAAYQRRLAAERGV